MNKSLDELLSELQAVCDKASTPPWAAKCSIIDVGDSGYYSATRACGPSHITYGGFAKEVLVSPSEANLRAKFDVEFIAQSRTAVPLLISALRKAIEQRDAYCRDSCMQSSYNDVDELIKTDNDLVTAILQGRG